MNDLKKSITVVLNTKGGVGKSTTVLQVLAPYLFKTINKIENFNFDSQKHTKIKIYDIDARNRSSQILSQSKLFDSVLIDKCDIKLEKELNSLFSDFSRDYPVVFDVGNTFTESFIEVMGNVFFDKKINFLIPLKQDDDDARNAGITVNLIKKYIDKNANISFVLSDSIANVDAFEDIKLEFEMVFGGYYDFSKKTTAKSLFFNKNIDPNRFFVIKKTMGVGNLLVRSKVWTRQTIWENALLAQDMKINQKNKYLIEYKRLQKELNDFRKKNDEKNFNEMQIKYTTHMELIGILNHCKNYVNDHLEKSFDLIDKKEIII